MIYSLPQVMLCVRVCVREREKEREGKRENSSAVPDLRKLKEKLSDGGRKNSPCS